MDRFAGCLVGLCLGDAVGASIAECPGESSREFFRSLDSKGWWDSGQVSGSPASLRFTDGAQLAVALVESFVERRGFDPAAFAERLTALVTSRQITRRRWETYKAAKNMAGGIAWHEAGIESSGNGAAQRAAPIGLFFFRNADQVRSAATSQARVTHHNQLAVAGAVAVAAAVSQLIRAAEIRVDELLEYLVSCANDSDGAFSSRMAGLRAWLKLPPEAALVEIRATAPADPFSNAPGGIASHVVPTTLWSFYALLNSEGDFLRAMELAFYPGGDVISLASIVGALSGAQVGLESLPRAPCRHLAYGSGQGLDYLVELARDCHRIAVSQSENSRAT